MPETTTVEKCRPGTFSVPWDSTRLIRPNGIYVIGCPLLEETCIQLPNGKQFTVKAPKRNEKDIYIQSARLNGKNYNKTYLSHEDILKGGTLEFKMGDRPSRWGTAPNARPE